MNIKTVLGINTNDIDIEMISILQNTGPKHLSQCIERTHVKSEKSIINNYQQLYLSSPYLFKDNYDNYVQNILYDGCTLWNMYDMTDKQKHFKNIIRCIQQKKFDEQIELYQLLSNNNTDSFDDKNLWNEKNFIFTMLRTKLLDNTEITKITSIIKIILPHGEIQKRFVKMCEKELNKNIGRDHKNNSKNEKFLNNLMLLIITLFIDTHTTDNKNSIDVSYIKSNSCNMKWTSTKKNKNTSFNFLTQLFFLSLYTIRISYISTLIIYKSFIDEIKYYKTNNISPPTSLITRTCDLQHITTEKNTINTMNNFYDIFFNILRSQDITNTHVNNDIFNDYALYLKYIYDIKNIQITNKNIIQVIIDIIGTTKYVTSLDIRNLYIIIIGVYDEHNKICLTNNDISNLFISISSLFEEKSNNIHSKFKLICTITHIANKNSLLFVKFLETGNLKNFY